MTSERDPFGLLEPRPGLAVKLGSTDISGAVRGGSVTGTMGGRGSATLNLAPNLLPPDPVDYFAPLEIKPRRDSDRALFVGHAATAVVDDSDRIRVDAYGASLLTEQTLGHFEAADVTAAEITYLIARAAGMSDDQLVIEGLDDLPIETFEVLSPLYGVRADRPTQLAGVTLVPPANGRASLIELGFDEDELGDADAYAVSVHTDRLGFAAERAGLDAINLAVDWLAVRLRYGLAQFPDGHPQPFDRDSRRVLPTRGDLVAVRGLLTQRRWLRSTAMQLRASTVAVDPTDRLLSGLPDCLSPAERLALAACRRAASESDALARVQALWEAIEFLVAGVAAPRLFPTMISRRSRMRSRRPFPSRCKGAPAPRSGISTRRR
jgi:hypothetical protein